MKKLHVIFKKEEIDEQKIQGKIAVVFDVLLATSTITSALYFGAKEVIPVLNKEDAETEAVGRDSNSYLLVGEYEGKVIKGFLDPNPLKLKEVVEGKSMILSTTNGTVAIRKASCANKVYISSLLNGNKIANQLVHKHSEDTIVLICSGSAGEFCIEDFYGAGYLLSCLVNSSPTNWRLTDAARAALEFFRGTELNAKHILGQSHVGQMLEAMGYIEELNFVAEHGTLPIAPILKDQKIILKEER